MSLLDKFGAEQGDRHPGPLTWPGSGLGLPILGRAAPNIRQDEFEGIDHKCVYHAKEFRSWVPEDMEEYRYVQEHANNISEAGVTWFAIRQYERIRDPQDRGWLIWLEWVQVYGVLTKELMASGGPDAIKGFVQRSREAEFLGGGSVAVNPPPESWEQAEADAGMDHPGPATWPLPTGARGYFDPFAPRR
jgi:hypothetical protein